MGRSTPKPGSSTELQEMGARHRAILTNVAIKQSEVEHTDWGQAPDGRKTYQGAIELAEQMRSRGHLADGIARRLQSEGWPGAAEGWSWRSVAAALPGRPFGPQAKAERQALEVQLLALCLEIIKERIALVDALLKR